MEHNFGRTLEKFSRVVDVNAHKEDCLLTVEGGADSMVAEWKTLNPEIVVLAFKKYLIQTGSPYNIVRIT